LSLSHIADLVVPWTGQITNSSRHSLAYFSAQATGTWRGSLSALAEVEKVDTKKHCFCNHMCPIAEEPPKLPQESFSRSRLGTRRMGEVGASAMEAAKDAGAQKVSPFLDHGPRSRANSLAIVQLARDQYQPVFLIDSKGSAHDGYAEGAVLNTRFGSFPHSTLINQPWGSQIRASKVDTGSRGKKRKREGTEDTQQGSEDVEAERKDGVKEVVTASSGFVHILPPTPEIWTSSLPHRTQVVYTPDYSYILHRIRARPGTRLIEAGSGSGSFTHAAARAVFNGYPKSQSDRKGRVFSFEVNHERFEKMEEEIAEHGLDDLVTITHRDVYKDGFAVDGKSPEANAVFLDVPAPWEALPHLSRSRPPPDKTAEESPTDPANGQKTWISPLNPKRSVYICTFSPCVEQVTKTVSTMRRLGWRDIEMVEVAHRRIQVYRERIGLDFQDDRGVNLVPKDVNEALTRLREIEDKNRRNREALIASTNGTGGKRKKGDGDAGRKQASAQGTPKPWMQGRLETRFEPEIKTHTSYLVFAILPREWSAEDEAAAAAKWPVGNEKGVIGGVDRESTKQAKRERLAAKN
jgi:tRNA (adenine57-N1/adenine58-N1)-methyltransferase catalytic subunit